MRFLSLRGFSLFAALCMGAASLLHAADPVAGKSPATIVEGLYSAYLKPDEESSFPPLISEEFEKHLTGRLKEQVQAMNKAQEGNPDLSLGYDPLIDGQDFDVKEFKVTESEEQTTEAGKTREVTVTFTNFGEKRRYVFRFVQPKGTTEWLLEEVECRQGTEGRTYQLQSELETALKDTES